MKKCPWCGRVFEKWWRETFGAWGCGACPWQPEQKKKNRKYTPFTWIA